MTARTTLHRLGLIAASVALLGACGNIAGSDMKEKEMDEPGMSSDGGGMQEDSDMGATTWAPPTWEAKTQWSLRWEDATPGSHTATVRALAGDGELQTAEQASPAPDGASGWHQVQFRVR